MPDSATFGEQLKLEPSLLADTYAAERRIRLA